MYFKRKLNILACFLITGAGQGFLYNTLKVYIIPVCESLGLLRSEVTSYSTIIMLTAVFCAPIFANLYRLINLKLLMTICTFICTLSTLGFSYSSTSWHFYLFSIIFGIGFNGINLTVGANIINEWFDKRKGIATGISFAGSGFFASAMIMLLADIIIKYDWRVAYRFNAICSFILLMIAIHVFLKINPTKEDLLNKDNEFDLNQEANKNLSGLTKNEALKTPMFYLLVIGTYLLGIAVQSGNINMIVAFNDAGHDVMLVTKASSITLIVLGFSKILIGRFIDKIGMLLSVILFAVSTAISYICFIFPDYHISLILVPYLIGFGAGGYQISVSLLARTIFGNKDFAKIFALLNIAQLLGTASGGVVPSLFYDLSGTYELCWYILFVASLVAVFLYLLALKLNSNRVKNLCLNNETI